MSDVKDEVVFRICDTRSQPVLPSLMHGRRHTVIQHKGLSNRLAHPRCPLVELLQKGSEHVGSFVSANPRHTSWTPLPNSELKNGCTYQRKDS